MTLDGYMLGSGRWIKDANGRTLELGDNVSTGLCGERGAWIREMPTASAPAPVDDSGQGGLAQRRVWVVAGEIPPGGAYRRSRVALRSVRTLLVPRDRLLRPRAPRSGRNHSQDARLLLVAAVDHPVGSGDGRDRIRTTAIANTSATTDVTLETSRPRATAPTS